MSPALFLFVPLLSLASRALVVSLARSVRRDPDWCDGAVLLRYAGLVRTLFWMTGAQLLAVSAWLVWPLAAGSEKDVDVYFALAIVPFAVPAALFFLLESRVRLVADANGISGRTAFCGHRQIVWRHVVDAKFSPVGWLTLRDRRGAVLRVPRAVRGFHAVSDQIPANARRGVRDEFVVATDVWSC